MSVSSKRLPLLALLVLSVASSCAVVHNPGKSPLARTQMSRDSVVLDVFFVRFPIGQEQVEDRLWEEIDEQHLNVDTRRQLNKSGFRVGVVTGQIPKKLAQLLETTDKPAAAAGEVQKVQFQELETDPRVVWRHLQCRTGRRAELLASQVYDELPVLMTEANGLCGQTYQRAQGLLAVKTSPEADGRVRIDLTPELHYGDPRQRFVGEQGAMRMETGRERRVFQELALSATLAPGHILVLSTMPARPGSLGYHFFTTISSGQREQKLLAIRLSQTQHDGLFDPQQPLSLEESEQ